MRIAVIFAALFAAAAVHAETMRMAVTTSFNNSGLSDVLLPEIEADLGLTVDLLVVGTGQALRLGAAGDVDAVLVHARSAEEAFVEAGHATHRREIMYNDFVVIGPADDPAGAADAGAAGEAFAAISAAGAPFVSRGDESGTHKKEMSIWAMSGATPTGGWYRSIGAGMGAALNTAAAMGAYIMSDRASWLNFANKRGLAILFEGDPALFNQYAYLPVSAAKHPHVKAEPAARLEAWLAGPRAAALIDGYEIDGQRLFTHNAK